MTEEIHARKSLGSAFRLFGAYLAFARQVLRKWWWLALAVLAVSTVIGYFNSKSTTNRYEVRAAFLIPSKEVLPEYERLLSRKLVARAVAGFKVSRLIDRGSNGFYEMYTESPFKVRVLEVHPLLKDIPIQFKILDAREYEVVYEVGEDIQEFKGKFGEDSRLGNLVLRVDLARALEQRMVDERYALIIHSPEAVVNRFLDNLDLVNNLDHPNRITLQYTDDHPDLAFDLLSAFTKAYLDIYEEQRLRLHVERMREVDAEVRLLEQQLRATPNPEPYLQSLVEASSKLPVLDSTTFHRLDLRTQQWALRDRLATWSEFGHNAFAVDSLRRRAGAIYAQPYDTILGQLVGLGTDPDSRLRQARILDSLAAWDQAQLTKLDRDILETDAELIFAQSFLRNWERTWITQHNDANGIWLILRERYLAALSETARLELETRKEVIVGPQLIDPPFHVKTYGRSIRVRLLVATVLCAIGAIIFCLLLLELRRKVFQSLAHFMVVASDSDHPLWVLSGGDHSVRKQVVNMELSLGDAKSVVILGQAGHRTQLAQALAAQLNNYGRKVAILGAETHAPDQGLYALPSSQEGWWISPESKQRLAELEQNYDRILVLSPLPDEVPESLGMLSHISKRYLVLKPAESLRTEWQNWKVLAREWGLDFSVVWLD